MKRVLLGVTGGIAAFRACDLVGLFRDRGIETRVAMTRAATRFVQPLTFAALTGQPVLIDELDGPADPTIPHLALARFADMAVVAPATADFLARAAHGFGDDGLTCALLGLEANKPVLLCPAMNSCMWENPLVQANLARLRELGGGRFHVLPPVAKRLACGETGVGGLPAGAEIVARCVELLIATYGAV